MNLEEIVRSDNKNVVDSIVVTDLEEAYCLADTIQDTMEDTTDAIIDTANETTEDRNDTVVDATEHRNDSQITQEVECLIDITTFQNITENIVNTEDSPDKDSAALLEVNKDETMDSDCFVEAWNNQEIDQCTATQRERSLTATNNENEVQETFKCAICREVFDDNIDFKQHQKDTGHTRGRKKHKCPTCCILLSRSAYYYHVTSCNAENIVYKCYVCREVFQDIETLTKHEKKFGHVRSKKRVKCHKCTKSVAPSGYFTHMENYHSLKHKCQKCDEAFDARAELKDHVKTVHETSGPAQKVCHQCGFVTAESSTFSNHLRKHRPSKKRAYLFYDCEECARSFPTLGALDVHERLHTGEKPYVCQECGMRFRQSKSLRRHRLIHTGEKPYSCHLCTKSFNQNGNLKVHLKSHERGTIKTDPKKTNTTN